jgi:hypothetical protein
MSIRTRWASRPGCNVQRRIRQPSTRVAAIGDFAEPHLRDDTLTQIRPAGGDVVQSQTYRLVGTVPDADPAPSADEE